MVNNWLNSIHFRVLPLDCLYCGGHASGQIALCPACQQNLQYNHFACKTCAEPLPSMAGNHSAQQCGKCLKKRPHFDYVISPYLYEPPISTLISRFKYHADLGAGNILATLLAGYLQKYVVELPDCIIPVPLHPSRLRQRGFNQSLELSRPLAKQLSIPLLNDICTRQRKTDSQKGLNEKQRQKNIRGAFSMGKPLPYQRIAIVDDVMTTGNTVNELAKTLRLAGAKNIQIWSVCRASNKNV